MSTGEREYDCNDMPGEIIDPSFEVDDPVNFPKHYLSSPAKCRCGKGIECIEVARHFNFCLGNALKYIWREDLKGNALEDLKKARWYLDDEIKRRESNFDKPSSG